MLKIDQSKSHNYPKTKQAWANLINKLHEDALNHRRPYEFQWAINTAFYRGFQKMTYNKVTGNISGEYDDSQYVINRIAPFVESRVAKLIRTKPILTVIPDKMDPLTLKAAQLSERLLKHLWKCNRKDQKLLEAVTLAVLHGCSFKKNIWNSEGGDPIKSEQDDEGYITLAEETGQAKMNSIFMGEIDNTVRSAFSILASPFAKSLESAEYVFDRSLKTVQDIKEMFPEVDVTKLVNFEEQLTRYEQFVNKLMSSSYSELHGYVNTQTTDVEGTANVRELQHCLVKEFWMRPNQVYQQGVLATVVGDQLVQFESFPYEHMEYPFIKIDEHYNPFGFYGISTIERLIPIQKHYNQARTQISKNASLMANGKWWAAKGCGLSEEALTDEEGEVVETNPNLPKPEQMAIAPLPNYVIESQNQDIIDIRDVGGEREATMNPFPNITAGVALETAEEISNIGLIPTVRGIETALIKEGRQELLLANQYYTDERILKVYGNGNELIIEKYKNVDLMHQTDVSIQLESAIGQSKAAMRQSLIDLWDRRIISDPKAFLKAYATGTIDVIMKEDDGVEKVIIEELEDVKQGKQPVVSQFDNHIMHVQMLSKFIQTPEFRRLPPDRQALAVQTLQQHLQFLQPQQQPEQNPAAVGTPFGAQVTEGGEQVNP